VTKFIEFAPTYIFLLLLAIMVKFFCDLHACIDARLEVAVWDNSRLARWDCEKHCGDKTTAAWCWDTPEWNC